MLPYESARIALEGFEPGGRVVGLTKGQFSLIDMVNVLLEKIGPADVVISTWSAGLRDTTALQEMKESGRVRSVTIITDRSYPTRQPGYALSMEEAFGKENIRTTNTHAKFVLLKSDTCSVCIRSSMNLNKNDRCENFDVDDDPDIFGFFNDFVQEVFQKSPLQGFIESRSEVDPVFKTLMKKEGEPESDISDSWANTPDNW